MRTLLFLILFSSCTYNFPQRGLPTSSQPGKLSSTTGLIHNDLIANSFYINRFNGFPDSKVLGYNFPKDTTIEAFFQVQFREGSPFGFESGINYPGTVWVSKYKAIDETEITNLHWAEFLYYIKRDSSKLLYQQMQPDESKLPKEDYYSNPFFRFYPVVGITYEQAVIYCRWRTDVVTELTEKAIISKGLQAHEKYTFEFRLPTEVEWETYAACGIDINSYPYGVKYTTAAIKVKPKAANYLKRKNSLDQTIKEIENDIKEFNKLKPEITIFNVDREDLPYFLQSKTPFYVFDLPVNNYGIYNMIGNVAELVYEKGITKGGSYLDKLEDSKIGIAGRYEGAAPNVGFRAICEIKLY